jgi:cysteine-rich repeat protein
LLRPGAVVAVAEAAAAGDLRPPQDPSSTVPDASGTIADTPQTPRRHVFKVQSAFPLGAGPQCGDGYPDAGEECDDGNDVETDDCLSICKQAVCGDGVVHSGIEECDDGDADNSDECLFGCVRARCGDGYVRTAAEICDDGNVVDGDGCSADCRPEPSRGQQSESAIARLTTTNYR